MNWTILVYGGPMTMIIIWWIVSARKWFKGPKVLIDTPVSVTSPHSVWTKFLIYVL